MKNSIIIALGLVFLVVMVGCAKQESQTNTQTGTDTKTDTSLPQATGTTDIAQVDSTIKEADTTTDVVNSEEINDLSLTDVNW